MEENIEVEITFRGNKIKIRGNNLNTILSQIDREATKSIENILAKLESVKSDIDSDSIQALLKDYKPRSFYDKILTCVYYLYTKGKRVFNQNDLREAFIEALFPLPQNVVDLLNKLRDKGFVAEHMEKKDGLKSWYITQEGLGYVQKGFSEESD